MSKKLSFSKSATSIMKNQTRTLIPLILIFILCNNFFLFGKNWLAKYNFDYLILIIANSLFFVVSIIVFMMQKKALQNKNPNVFVRSVMGGTMIKMFVTLIAIGIYYFIAKNDFSKMSVIASMILYFIYLIAEVSIATKMNKTKNG